MADTTDFRNGFTMLLDNDLFAIVEFQHVKPGKGSAFVRTKLRNVRTGAVLDRTFRSGDKVEGVRVEKREMQYLYLESDFFYFMDLETYDQMGIAKNTVGRMAELLKENEHAFVLLANNEAIGVELPNFVNLRVAHTEPGLRGDTATGAFKPATLETGAQVQVPLFVNQGDILKIDTRTGEYVERVY
jgi:elongation factor P